MDNKNKIGIIALIILVILGAIYFMNKPALSEPAAAQNASGTVDSGEQSEVEKVVINFGLKLRNVPVLAPANISGPAFDAEYGPYVTQELLTKWKTNPNTALGRQTSSPWPESVGIVSAVKNPSGSYTVEANVVEVTMQDPNVPTAVYPITLELIKDGSSWKISSATKGAYAELPKRVVLTGKQICLSPKDTTGPQTLECALGFKTDGGESYGLDLNLLQSTDATALIQSGVRVQVEGVIVPVEALSTDMWRKYEMRGILSVTSVTRL
jgi:hypothetical protein